MSRIGKNPVPVPSGVTVDIDGQTVTVKGPKGSLTHVVAEPITVEQTDGVIEVKRPNDERRSKSLHGLSRTLIANMVTEIALGLQAALREAEEEIGLARHFVEVIGELPTYTTGTRFIVTPVVALVDPGHRLALNLDEVDAAFEVGEVSLAPSKSPTN